jgi:hypothetical protein
MSPAAGMRLGSDKVLARFRRETHVLALNHPSIVGFAFPEPPGKRRISTARGRLPQWGAAGRELFCVSPLFYGAGRSLPLIVNWPSLLKRGSGVP